MPDRLSAARTVLASAIAARAFPAAVVEVGDATATRWREAFGVLSWEPDSAQTDEDTIFDLASLTKVIVTASLVMGLVEAGRLDIDGPLQDWLPDWRGTDRDAVTVRDLLEHCSGLTAWMPLFRDHAGRADFQRTICTLPLEYAPRSRSIYSDLGFMLLGFVVEDAGGASLRQQFEGLAASFRDRSECLAFDVASGARSRTAPTEVDRWRGRLLIGEVHDENAWALGGAAGHAGLFGTTRGVGAFARAVLNSLRGTGAVHLASAQMMRAFVTRSAVAGSSRALGWDTMLPTSSCGTRMSARAFGHSGFTGTSLWIDPEAGIYVVFLTNRVHPKRENEAIRTIRPALHDAIMQAVS